MHRATVDLRHRGCDWLYFVARSGEEGLSWAEEYQHHEKLEALSIVALHDLQKGRVAAGRKRLGELQHDLRSGSTMLPSIRLVLDRWYLGVDGYLNYLCGDFDAAERSIRAAHGAIAAAISQCRFLLLLANHCHEFGLHLARIARNRRCWREMEDHVEHVRRMMEDRLPLCVLTDGLPVYFSTLRAHCISMQLSDEETAQLSYLFDEMSRLSSFSRFVHQLYVLPGFAIPYFVGGAV